MSLIKGTSCRLSSEYFVRLHGNHYENVSEEEHVHLDEFIQMLKLLKGNKYTLTTRLISN